MYSSTSKYNDDANAKHSAQNENHSIKDVLCETGEKVRKNITLVNKKLTDASHATTTQIREKPVQSTVIALGVGYLLGKLFGR